MGANIDLTRDAEQGRIVSSRVFIEATIARYLASERDMATFVPGLSVARITSDFPPTSYLYEPSLCVCVRGAKRVLLGDTEYRYGEHDFLLTSVGLPTIIEIQNSSAENPYTALQLILDLDVARQLIAELDINGVNPVRTGAGMAVGPLTADLLDAVARLVGLLDKPQEVPFLNALVHREILYRVLTGPSGARLRQIVRLGSQSNKVSNAIAWLRENFTRQLRIDELAEAAAMGVSTLHVHFRELTNMSPLQYQKHLRLHEARRLMLNEEMDAATAAFRVGYESPSQFSREYRRLFGESPLRDVKALRSNRTPETV